MRSLRLQRLASGKGEKSMSGSSKVCMFSVQLSSGIMYLDFKDGLACLLVRISDIFVALNTVTSSVLKAACSFAFDYASLVHVWRDILRLGGA